MSIFDKKINYGNGKLAPKPVHKINYPGEPNIEVDSEVELNELQVAFREKAKAEKDMQVKNTDSEFWSCVVFKTKEQRDSFLKLLNINEEDAQYINGQKLIKALELRIEQIEEKAPGKFRCNAEILELCIKQ
jgi:hypothetical protein